MSIVFISVRCWIDCFFVCFFPFCLQALSSRVVGGGVGAGGGSQKALRKKRVWKCTPTGGKIPGGAN